MAIIKPGAVKGPYTWTGKRWVRTPQRMSDKVAIAKEIKQNPSNKKAANAAASYPGGMPAMSKTSPVNSGKKVIEGPKSSTSKPTAAQVANARNPGQKPAPTKPTATKPTPTKPTATKPASSSSSSTSKTTAKSPAKKMGTVNQSNTEWVKKGDVVNGKTITKGYVAQKGKPERKVTANVKLVVDTARGKAGSKVSYSKGQATKGKGK